MNRMDYYLVLFTLFLASDATLLWRINVDPPAYLFGTAHLPYPLIWPSLSDTVKSAFYNSTHFLPEFDMTNFFSFTRFRMCINSPKASKVHTVPSSGFSSQYSQTASILDVHLMLEARRLKKTVISLESVDMYCEFTKFQIDSLINNITSHPSPSPSSNANEYEQVKHVYNCDLNCPGEIFPSVPMSMINPSVQAFQQRLGEIVRRRDAEMSKTIDSLVKEGSPDKRFFFAAGFVHLMGADGIVTKLKRDYNYSITRLCTDPPDFRTTLGCQGPSWCDQHPGL